MVNNFWQGKRVFITGHTGFKGSWLSLWLNTLGAEICGYSLEAPTKPSLFELCRVADLVNSIHGDVRDYEKLKHEIEKFNPEIIFHMAAQPLVGESYKNPILTYDVNVMGTINVLETARNCSKLRVIINVTTDKCYENKEWYWAYRENDPLGGYDPYSSSKACSEIVTSSYRNAFFNPDNYDKHGVGVATVRAGNVIGGGDWALNRLVPDCIRSILENKKIIIRNPHAIRPWQHVLEPLKGYMTLAEAMYGDGVKYGGGWNFGPDDDAKPVEWIVKEICQDWNYEIGYTVENNNYCHEAQHLRLDCSKAKYCLNWQSNWDIKKAIEKIVKWSMAYKDNGDMREVCFDQLNEYQTTTSCVQIKV